eukprot:13097207-Alexandrium_andersonii.AAC.1
MVCKAILDKGRPVDCWSATAVSTTATGSSTSTDGSISGAESRIDRSTGDCASSTTSGAGPMGSTAG